MMKSWSAPDSSLLARAADTKERVRDFERPRGRHRCRDTGKVHADLQPVARALERGTPGAGPHQSAEELVPAIVHEQQRHERLGRAAIGPELDPFAGIEIAVRDHERVFDVAARRVAAEAAQPPNVAEGHRHLPADEIRDRRALAAAAA